MLEIGGKPHSVSQIQGQYMGLLLFTPQGWSEVIRIRSTLSEHQRDSSHMTGTLQLVINEGRLPISALAYQGDWGEVDSQQDLIFYNSKK